jgi:hypothetical protein
VLHTWGQNLLFHPHLHCVVPGGGLSPDGNRWISCRINRPPPEREAKTSGRENIWTLKDGAGKNDWWSL